MLPPEPCLQLITAHGSPVVMRDLGTGSNGRHSHDPRFLIFRITTCATSPFSPQAFVAITDHLYRWDRSD